MTRELAQRVFAARGGRGPIEPLAEGMSSSAWIGRIEGVEWVVRVPVPGDARPDPDYRGEAALNAALRQVGVPATDTQPVEIDGTLCSIAPRLGGSPVRPDEWNDEFVNDVASALAATHSIPVGRHRLSGAVERFHLARLWPLDDTDLHDHPITRRLPGRVGWIESQRDAVATEAHQPACVVHSDLHWDHLLRTPDGRLGGLLDFGDAFAGPPAWDFACLRYYHGLDVVQRVAAAYPGGDDVLRRSARLGIAFALYKLDKTPDRVDVVERVDHLAKPIGVE
jgi:aminoglycoside phosphotransferase (APT) family kinase protein